MKSIIALVLFTGMSSWALAQEPPLKVFVLAGQSNMHGAGASDELPANLRQPNKDVLVFQKGVWVPLEPGKTFGPEVTFGRAMAKHFGQPIGIIKLAKNGTNLAVQWSPDDPKSLYAKLAKTVKEAQKNRPIVIAGMLWMQGAADAKQEAMAQTYQKNLTRLIESARRDFGDAGLPFACGRINAPAGLYPHVEIVRKSQAAIELPAYRMVNCDDLAKNRDKLHYSAQGQQELGNRFAAAIIELLKQDKARQKHP